MTSDQNPQGQPIPVIAIDGPTASGKGTIAQRVAAALGFHYLDSGALYRLAALEALESGIDLEDEAALGRVAGAIAPRFAGESIQMDGREVGEAIRAEAVGVAASKIAVFPAVRQALFDLQLRFRQAPGLVADGRDMASVVFPDAELKVFLTASPEARAERRHKQLMAKGIQTRIADLARDLRERDERDMKRSAAPLAPAQGAKLLDSSALTIDEVVAQVLEWYREA